MNEQTVSRIHLDSQYTSEGARALDEAFAIMTDAENRADDLNWEDEDANADAQVAQFAYDTAERRYRIAAAQPVAVEA